MSGYDDFEIQVCLLRFRDVEHKGNALFHSHVCRWTAYIFKNDCQDLNNLPEKNIIAQSDDVSYSANIFVPNSLILRKYLKIEKESYQQILAYLQKDNWIPQADYGGFSFTFTRKVPKNSEVLETFNNVDLEDFRPELEILLSLLNDSHPGLSTWNTAVLFHLQMLDSLIAKALGKK